MPTALEITFQFSSGSVWTTSPTLSPMAACMQAASPVINDAENTLVSGSLLAVGNSLSNADMTVMLEQTMSSGSLLGPANAISLATVAEEENNTSQTTNGNPSPAESAVQVDWNVFEIVSAEQEPTTTVLAERDSTRFKKAYSFTRQQPVKVRVYRR